MVPVTLERFSLKIPQLKQHCFDVSFSFLHFFGRKGVLIMKKKKTKTFLSKLLTVMGFVKKNQGIVGSLAGAFERRT